MLRYHINQCAIPLHQVWNMANFTAEKIPIIMNSCTETSQIEIQAKRGKGKGKSLLCLDTKISCRNGESETKETRNKCDSNDVWIQLLNFPAFGSKALISSSCQYFHLWNKWKENLLLWPSPALTSPAGRICNGDLRSYFCRGPSSHSHTLFSQTHRMPAPLASVWKNR